MKYIPHVLVSLVASLIWIVAIYQGSAPQAPYYYLTFKLENPVSTIAQVFYHTGRGWNEQESEQRTYQGYIDVSFPLQDKPVLAIRFDPTTLSANKMRIFSIKIMDDRGFEHQSISLENLQPTNAVESFDLGESYLEFRSTVDNGDVQLLLNLSEPIDVQNYPQQYRHPLTIGWIVVLFVFLWLTIGSFLLVITPAAIVAYRWVRSRATPSSIVENKPDSFFKTNPVLSIGLILVFTINLIFAIIFSANYYFLMDDFWVLNIAQINPFTNLYNEAHISFYRPLVFTLFKIQIHLFGWGAPALFSLVSLLIHILNCSLLAYLVWKLLADRRISAFAAVLYFMNPWAGESTLWFCLQSDLAAVTGSLIVLILGLNLDSEGKSSRLRFLWIPLSLFAASLFGYLGKESALTLPAIYGLILAIRYPVITIFINPRFYANMGAICLSLLVYMYLRSQFLSAFGGAYGNYFDLLKNLDLAQLLHSYVTPAVTKANAFYSTLTLLNIVLLVAALIMAAKGHLRAFTLLVIAFIFSLLPILNFTIPSNSSAGTRWHYLPSVIMVLLFAYGLHTALTHARSTLWQKGLVPALTIVYFVILSIFMQNQRNNWSKACEISRSCIEQFEQVRGKYTHYYLPNIPHQFREGSVIISSHVFRNRFNDHQKYEVRGVWNLIEDRAGKPVVYEQMRDRYSDYADPHPDEYILYFEY